MQTCQGREGVGRYPTKSHSDGFTGDTQSPGHQEVLGEGAGRRAHALTHSLIPLPGGAFIPLRPQGKQLQQPNIPECWELGLMRAGLWEALPASSGGAGLPSAGGLW